MPEAESENSRIAMGLSIDLPQQNEKIAMKQYTLRGTAPVTAKSVELCLDGEAWLPCLRAAGSWTHDWSDYASGEHEIFVRIRTAGDEVVSSAARQFIVEPAPGLDEANA